MRFSLPTLTLAAVAALAAGCTTTPSGTDSGSSPAPRPVQRCDQAGAQWAVGEARRDKKLG